MQGSHFILVELCQILQVNTKQHTHNQKDNLQEYERHILWHFNRIYTDNWDFPMSTSSNRAWKYI